MEYLKSFCKKYKTSDSLSTASTGDISYECDQILNEEQYYCIKKIQADLELRLLEIMEYYEICMKASEKEAWLSQKLNEYDPNSFGILTHSGNLPVIS